VHDPMSWFDLVGDEIRQRRESGYDVEGIHAQFAITDPDDGTRLEDLFRELGRSTRLASWSYTEPDQLDEILDLGDLSPDSAVPATYDRIYGSWLGRVAGCNLGKPLEEGRIWTRDHIERYLRLADSFPLRDYVPLLEPMPAEFELRENWPQTTRGRVHGSDRDDDIDYSILAVHLLDQHGGDLDTRHIADAWLAYLPLTRTYTAERATYVNLIHGEAVENSGAVRNPYREWIGALIRGDAFGWVHPGQPARAAQASYRDAVLSHRGNGIYAEMWSAALLASALDEADVESVIERATAVVPRGSRLREAIDHVRGLHSAHVGWDAALTEIHSAYGHYEWVHSVNNAALITAGLLWSEGDFSAAVGNTVQGGWDTDSNGATVGAVMGALLGAQALPEHFIVPLEDRTRSAVFGYDHSRISDLANRTLAISQRLN
jgi:ADP-ribosylglycohydrolase